MTDDRSDPGVLQLAAGAVSWREVDGEAILLDVGRGEYLGVNASGTLLWTLLAGGTTRPALEHALRESFDLSPRQAGADVATFLTEVRARGLLR